MEDEKIIDLYFERNENAVAETALKYGRMLRAIAYGILKNHQDSEECENDTYHVVWNKIPPERPSYFSAFLGRIVRNISFGKYNYNNAAKRNPDVEVSLSELENCISAGNTTEQHYDCQRTAKYISDFLKKLPVTKRVIFIRRYWYCDSILQISEKYGFSESKVKSMLMRIRNELRKHLERQGVRV